MTISPLRTAAIVVAAGRGERAGDGGPKQYRPLGGIPVLRHSLERLAAHPDIVDVIVVIHPDDEAEYRRAAEGLDLAPFAVGAAARQDSVLAGLEALATREGADIVLIHDAARPFIPSRLVGELIAGAEAHGGAVPALPVVDSLRRGGDVIEGEVARDGLYRVQTPQAFRFGEILNAHRSAAPGATDDAAIARAAGMRVAIVPGDESLFKLTFVEDFDRAERLLNARPCRTGMGYDVHRLGPGDHVWLCGIRVPHGAGLIGHSDADVGLHALTDALLGAAAEGDIGDHFPPSDETWRGAASDRFLAHAAALIRARGGRVEHVDVTLVCEAPKIGPHRAAMRARIAEILQLSAGQVSVKATTSERLGFTGRREGIAAQAVATIRL